MSTPIMVPMIAPDGSIGEIPQKRVNEAVQAGGKLGVWMRSPQGEIGIIPRSNLVPALKAGGKLEKNEPTGPIGEESQVQSFDSPPVTSFKQGATAAVRGVGDVMEGIGRGAIGLAKFPYDVAKAVATKPETTGDYAAMGLGPLGLPLKRLVTDPMQATAEQSRGETGIKKTAMQFASGLPVVGPMAAGFAEQIQKPEDIGKAGGEAIAFKEFPTVVGGALGEVPAIQSYLKERNLRLGEQGIKDLSKAPAKNLQFGDDLKLSIPELQKIQREAPLEAGGNLKVGELVEKLDKRLDEKWQDDHIAVIERHPDLPVDHAAIYKAGMEKLTEGEVRADPAGAKAAQSWLNKQVNKPMNVRTADQFRHGLTLKTKAKFGQDAPILMEVQKAVLHETRQQIDASLINAGESSITKANRSWGALDNVRNTLEARMNAAERAPSRGGMALGAVTGFVGSSLKGKWLGAVLNLRELIKVAKGGPGEQLNAALDRLVKGGTPPAKPTQAAGPIAVPPQVPVPVAAPPTPPIPKPRSLAVNPPVKATPPTTPTAGGVVPVAPPVVPQAPPAAVAPTPPVPKPRSITEVKQTAPLPTDEAVRRGMSDILEHGKRNEAVKNTIESIDERGVNPKDVMRTFWDETYPALDETGKKNFERQMKAQLGMEPGDILLVDKAGNKVRAKSWREISESGLEDDIHSVEQNYQAIVGLAEILNQMKDKFTQTLKPIPKPRSVTVKPVAAAAPPISTPGLPRTGVSKPPPEAAPASPVGAAPASESTLQTPKAEESVAAKGESKAPITITASSLERSKINYGGKVSKRTGLNPSQEEFLASRLVEVAPTLKQPINASYQPGYKPIAEAPPPPVTIKVPGDGSFTVASDKAASRLHSQITGKPIEGAAFEKKGKGTFRASPKEWDVKVDVERAVGMYGTASKAAEFLKRQLEAIKDLPETESTWKLESVISRLDEMAKEGLPPVPKPRSKK